MDELEWWELENLRRSIALLRPGQPATGLKREDALVLLDQLQRLQRRDRRVTELVTELQAVLDAQ